jgi:hypothetical protein
MRDIELSEGVYPEALRAGEATRCTCIPAKLRVRGGRRGGYLLLLFFPYLVEARSGCGEWFINLLHMHMHMYMHFAFREREKFCSAFCVMCSIVRVLGKRVHIFRRANLS